jgi:hypothetical protein
MPEGLATPDGTVLDVPPADTERDFAMAMAAPEPSEDVGPPPKRDPSADPDAPYGRTKDGKPKKGPGGRPARTRAETAAEAPRVQPAAAAVKGLAEYKAGLNDTAVSVWGLLAMTPMTLAQATLFKIHQPSLVHGFALGATQNDRVRVGVEWLTREAWMLIVLGAAVPFAIQSFMLWTNPERLPISKTDLEAIALHDVAVMQEQAAEAMRAAAEAPMAA